MSWFKKILPKVAATDKKKGVPEGIWSKCDGCNAIIYRAELERNQLVCAKCGYHMRLDGRERLISFLDSGETVEIAHDLEPVDRLKFRDSKKYKDRLSAAQKKTNETEAIVVLRGQLNGLPVVAAAFNFGFIGGSMSAGVGERFVRGVETAIAEKLPFICFAASGGARMQEGLFSLFQMAKTSAVLSHLDEMKLPFISVLTNPTMGGVSASLAMLGDVILAEPNALIGFAGPSVIEQTIRQTLPEGFQRSEFLLDHGAIDQIVDRRELRDTISNLLRKMTHQDAPAADENTD